MNIPEFLESSINDGSIKILISKYIFFLKLRSFLTVIRCFRTVKLHNFIVKVKNFSVEYEYNRFYGIRHY